MDTIIPFTGKRVPEKKKPLNITSVEQIGFLTTDDRDLWINDPADVLKIMRFIIKEKISIKESNE